MARAIRVLEIGAHSINSGYQSDAYTWPAIHTMIANISGVLRRAIHAEKPSRKLIVDSQKKMALTERLSCAEYPTTRRRANIRARSSEFWTEIPEPYPLPPVGAMRNAGDVPSPWAKKMAAMERNAMPRKNVRAEG